MMGARSCSKPSRKRYTHLAIQHMHLAIQHMHLAIQHWHPQKLSTEWALDLEKRLSHFKRLLK